MKSKNQLLYSVLSLLLCISMLLGTTFAWFTDSVETGINTIAAGNLDVELYHSNAAVQNEKVDASTELFMDLNGKDILWEPGVVSYENLRVVNEGDLALAYQLALNTANENYIVDPATGAQYGLSQVLQVGIVEGGITATDRDSVVASVKTANWTTLANFLRSGSLLPEGAGESEKTWGIVIYWKPGVNDNFWNLNNGKTLNEGDALTIDLGVKLIATQEVYEKDSFGDNYDTDAKAFAFPDFVGGSATAAIEVDAQGRTVADVTMTSGKIKVFVPAGVQVKSGVTKLSMSVSEMAASGANVSLGENEDILSLDVHVEGVADNNTVPITVTLAEVAPTGLNMGNYKLYHVESTGTKEMTLVDAAADFNAHNQFKYDPATGNVALYMATFSEVAVVADTVNPWEGKVDHSWYVGKESPYTIANADQLWSFSQIVGGMNGQTQNSFSGKTVKLISDINLGDKESKNNPNIIFYPIGYYNSEGTYERTNTAITSGLRNFEGTFDGNGHTVSNFYQNTWEMKGDHNWYSPEEQYYRDGMGLFGRVYGGTVKNLTVKNFSSDGEIATTGVIAAYADGATFENIAIFNCNPRVYNIGNGGIVGCVGWYAKEAGLKTTFKNITVDNSNKISALWGSYDVACGGIVGQYYPTSGQTSAGTPANAGIHFENCHISAQMDVYNDVCANYQYYAYRYTGMLIGSVRENVTIDGRSYPKMDGITAEDCTVHFGTWNDYYYCEIIDNTTASYTHDYQMSRLVEIKAIDGTTITYLDGTTGTVPASGRANYVIVDYTKGHGTENATCYHFKDGEVWNHEDGGKETINGVEVLKEDKQHIYLEFNNLVTGYGWGVTSKGVGDLAGVTILDREVADSEVKFEKAGTAKDSYTTESTVTIGELFKAATISDPKLTIKGEKVQVTVSPIGETSTVTGTYVADTADWTQSTLTFSGTGAATITITDYYFCTPTTINVTITERTAVEKFETKFTGNFLYRVGNANNSPVALGTLFNAIKNVTGTVAITFETVAGNASGAYTSKTPWENGTIQFSGTGVVKVAITDNDYCTPTVLYLEVVDAKNITSASGSNGTNVVLLNDVKISTNGTANYTDCIVYGNGFTFDVRGGMNQYNSKQGHGIIIAKNATLDHLRIVGDVYDEYGMYTTGLIGNAQNDYTGAVDATGCIIQNCYIANCATPIRSNGNTIIDTTLYGGTVANLLISGGTNTLTNVTTVNYNDGRGVIGMGIVITDGASADSTKLILNGYLKQHNYVYKTDVSEINMEEAKTVFNSMFGNQFVDYHIGGNAVNTGIISINEAINLDENHFVDNANTGYLVKNDVTITFNALGANKTVDAAVASVPKTGSVNNAYVDNSYQQGDYLPTFDFDLGYQMQAKDNDDDTRYLIGDKNGLSAMYPKGESALTLDLTKLATVSKYAGVNYPVTAKCIGPDGKEQTGTVVLDTKGTYTLVFTVNDNVFYDQNGNMVEKNATRTYEVSLVLDVYEKSIADATMTISNANLTGEYIASGSNKKYKMYPLNAITSIMDDANKDGELETFEFKKNIQSAVLTPDGNNAFSNPTTITVTYTGGQVLTIVLGTPSGLNSPGASNGGKTFSVKTDSTNGIYLQSDGAVASSSAVTGTWPLTSWSFKGTSGKVVTSNTKVTIDFTKPSSGDTGTCLAEGTLITLADGTKKVIEDLRKGDSVMAFDHLTGRVTCNDVIIVVKTQSDFYKNTFVFDDGTELVTINEHGIYDLNLQKYVNIDHENYTDYIGHDFVSVDVRGKVGTKKLVAVTSEWTTGYKYDIVTDQTLNYVAEDTLSVTHVLVDVINSFDFNENMCYDQEKMQADIEKYGLYTYDEWAAYCDISVFEQYNIPVMKVGISKGLYTKEYIISLINTYVLDESVQII